MKKVLLLILLLAPSFVFANENLYKKKWCADKRGEVNKVVGDVTVDCLTRSYAVAFSELSTWQEAYYKADALRSVAPGKSAGVVVMYDGKNYTKLRQLKAVAKAKGIVVWVLKENYLTPKPPIKVYKTKAPAKSKRQKVKGRPSYFTPSKKKVEKPQEVRPRVIYAPPTIIHRTTVRTVIQTKEVAPVAPVKKKSNYKPWLGDGFIDRLR